MGGGRNKINKSLLTPPPPTGTTRPYPGCIFRVDHTKRPPPERQPTSRLPPNPEPTAVAPRARAPLPPPAASLQRPGPESGEPRGTAERRGAGGATPSRHPTKSLLSPLPPGPAHRALPSPPPPLLPSLPPSLRAHKEPEGPPFPRGLRPKMEAGAPHTHPGGKGAVWGCCSAGCQEARRPRRGG